MRSAGCVTACREKFRAERRNPFAPAPFHGIDKVLSANSSSKPDTPKTTNNAIEVEGKIVAVLPGTMFRVQLANGHIVLGHISGKLRKHFIKIAAGDTVKMEMSPYDLEKARITYRVKDTSSAYRPFPRRRY
jgi:translation initiation factor IF-1